MEIDKEVPPLMQPLENIEMIKSRLVEIHQNIDYGREITADQVALAVLPYVYMAGIEVNSNTPTIVSKSFDVADEFMAQMNRRKSNE